MTNLIWRYNQKVTQETIDMGALLQGELSNTKTIQIGHNSNYAIQNCELYFSPYSETYDGTSNSIKDYERLVWFGDNYPGCGVSLTQKYNVSGKIEAHSGIRITDAERFESKDIFAGYEMEILSGPSVGEKVKISEYLPESKVFILEGDFSSDVTGESYKIELVEETFLKTRSASSYHYPVPLLHKA